MEAITLSLAALDVLLATGLAVTVHRFIRYRRKHRGFQPGLIKVVALEDFDPRFKTGLLGPSPTTEIRFVSGFKVKGTISDLETWVICNLAKTANRIFEFGTATGKTTYLMAANAPPDARISTLTLAPEQIDAYQTAKGDEAGRRDESLRYSFNQFFYTNTPEQTKIEQLLGDSKEFDESPYEGSMDLVFVDGSHAFSYVESDSRKALRMIKSGGIVLWHDYSRFAMRDVFRALNILNDKVSLVHIDGTTLVAYRKT